MCLCTHHAAADEELEMAARRATGIGESLEMDWSFGIWQECRVEICQTVNIFCTGPESRNLARGCPIFLILDVENRSLFTRRYYRPKPLMETTYLSKYQCAMRSSELFDKQRVIGPLLSQDSEQEPLRLYDPQLRHA
jgi:hypothetical protein